MTCCIWMYVTVHCDFAPMEKFLNENWQLIIVNNVPPLRLPTTNGCQTQISWERNYVSMVITKISFYCKKDTNSHSATLRIETGSFFVSLHEFLWWPFNFIRRCWVVDWNVIVIQNGWTLISEHLFYCVECSTLYIRVQRK